MSWLTIQMWLELLLAALFGGVIGWALYGMRRNDPVAQPVAAKAQKGAAERGARVLELEAQVKALQAESSELRARVADGGVATAAAAVDAGGQGEESLVWKNRYLESRVRFLDGKLKEAEGQLEAAQAAPAVQQDDKEAERLKWQVRYLNGRVKFLEEELAAGGGLVAASAVVPAAPVDARTAGGAPPEGDGDKPPSLNAPRGGKADDLKEIAGIGPKLERTLNDLGVFHFDQIAAWTAKEINWVNAFISFRGRIEREKWVDQAAELAKGLETEGKRKYREGRHT